MRMDSKETKEVDREQVEYFNASNEYGEEYAEVTVWVTDDKSDEFSQWGHIDDEEELISLLNENGYKLK
jgi:hypothetical protein